MSGYIRLTNVLGGAGRRVYQGTAPVDGTDEVQELDITGSPTGGTFKLSFRGATTAAIDFDASAAEVEAALEALSTIGTDGVAVADDGGNLPYTITFGGDLGKRVQPLITVVDSALTGGTDPEVTVTETTPGVDGTLIGHPAGTLYMDTENNELYANTGTANDPTWTVVGTQS